MIRHSRTSTGLGCARRLLAGFERVAPPLPASPARGEVPSSCLGSIVLPKPAVTLPLAGRVAELGPLSGPDEAWEGSDEPGCWFTATTCSQRNIIVFLGRHRRLLMLQR